MLSATANRGNETMPGDYESWSNAAQRMAPVSPGSGAPFRTPIPQLTPRSTAGAGAFRTPIPQLAPTVPPVRGVPMIPPAYPRRRRRRPITPEIVIERRPRHCYSSGRRSRVITIPLDPRPTLGLRGPPKRVIEIERVRCRRRRRHHSYCYDYDDDDRHYPPNVVMANPIPNPCLPAAPTPAGNPVTALFTHLTPEAIESLPRQTVHLPPIHLPGSQADENTELQTVILPAEMINPVDGTLSVIQANSSGNNLNVLPTVSPPINIAPTLPVATLPLPPPPPPPLIAQRPPVSAAMAADPLRQRFLDLFQRLRLSSPPVPAAVPSPPLPTIPNPPPARPVPLPTSEFEPAAGPYPPANIQPYRSSTFTPATLPNTTGYRNLDPNSSTAGYDLGPYRPANITPYTTPNSQPTGINTAYTPPAGPSMPRSILRNPYPTAPSNINYTRFNPSNVASASIDKSSSMTKLD